MSEDSGTVALKSVMLSLSFSVMAETKTVFSEGLGHVELLCVYILDQR